MYMFDVMIWSRPGFNAMMLQKDKKQQALATIYGNPEICLKTRLNKSLIESTRKGEHVNQTLESSAIIVQPSSESKVQKRPKSSQNFIFKPTKHNIRPSSKPKYEENYLLIPSVEAEFSPIISSHKTSAIYSKRPIKPQKRIQTKTGRSTVGGDKLANIIVNIKKK